MWDTKENTINVSENCKTLQEVQRREFCMHFMWILVEEKKNMRPKKYGWWRKSPFSRKKSEKKVLSIFENLHRNVFDKPQRHPKKRKKQTDNFSYGVSPLDYHWNTFSLDCTKERDGRLKDNCCERIALNNIIMK